MESRHTQTSPRPSSSPPADVFVDDKELIDALRRELERWKSAYNDLTSKHNILREELAAERFRQRQDMETKCPDVDVHPPYDEDDDDEDDGLEDYLERGNGGADDDSFLRDVGSDAPDGPDSDETLFGDEVELWGDAAVEAAAETPPRRRRSRSHRPGHRPAPQPPAPPSPPRAEHDMAHSSPELRSPRPRWVLPKPLTDESS